MNEIEIKSLKEHIKTTGNNIFATFKIETISNLIIYYEDLQKQNAELKEKINIYENPEDLTLFYMWLDEKAKDKMKELEEQLKETEIAYLLQKDSSDIYIKVLQELKEEITNHLIFCKNDSGGTYDKCNMVIKHYEKLLNIIEGEKNE